MIVLLLAGIFTVTAAPIGKQVPITPEISKFFSEQGVDPQYLGKPKDQVPEDQWNKIFAAVNMGNETESDISLALRSMPPSYLAPAAPNLTPYHDNLNTLVENALKGAVTQNYAPVYMIFGDSVWQYEAGDSANASYIAF
jgi:hypothetical protein